MLSSARKSLRDWIMQQIRELPAGTRLPSDAELQRAWNLGRTTIARVLAEFVERGSVTRSAGRGTCVGRYCAPPAQSSTASKPAAAAQMASIIRREITQGSLRTTDALPQIKYLCRRFHVSERTAIAACRILAEEKILCKSGKTYWIGTPAVLHDHGPVRELFFFTQTANDIRRAFSSDPFALAYQKMERELRRYGYQLRFELLSAFPRLLATWRHQESGPAGAIFYRVNPGDHMETSCAAINALLCCSPKPAILSDWTGGGMHPEIPRQTAVLSRGNLNTSMSRTIAAYLTGHGFREAVLCYNEENDSDSPLWHFWSFQKIAAELRKRDPDFRLWQVIQSRFPDEKLESFLSRMCDNRPDVPAYLHEKYPDLPPFNQFLKSLVLSSNLFEQLLHLKNARAWLFSRDSLAARACEWLQKNHLGLPELGPILGFENDPSYYHFGISSCCHDWERVGYVMAHALIGDIPLSKTSKGFICIESEIIEKRSSLAGNHASAQRA